MQFRNCESFDREESETFENAFPALNFMVVEVSSKFNLRGYGCN